MAKVDKETFAKLIHDVCVAAGVQCNHRACQAATPTVKRTPTSKTRRPNLTVAEAQRMSRR